MTGTIDPAADTRNTRLWRRSRLFGLAAVAVPALVFIIVITEGYDGRPYLRGDSQYYYYAALSLSQDLDLDLSNQLPLPLERHNLDVSLDQGGRLVPKHPIWMAVAALPLILLMGAPGALLFNLIQLLLLLLLSYIFVHRYASAEASSLAVALTGTASFLPHYVWGFSADVFVTTCLMAGLVALPSGRSEKLGRHFAAGLFLGLAVISKYSFILAVPGIILLCGRPVRKTVPVFASGFAVPVLMWALLNAHLFGSPLVTPYDRMTTIDHERREIQTQRSDFDFPLVKGMSKQLTDGKRGLIPTTPITIFSLFGLYALARRDRLTALYIGSTSIAFFLFFSKYKWWSASHHGNRFLIPVVILSAVPLAALMDQIAIWFRKRRDRARKAASADPPPIGE